jgi:hypothetical protein
MEFPFPPGAPDPRLGELRAIGLSRTWLDVAEAIGMEAFLSMWRLLDDRLQEDDRRPFLPQFSSYLRFQRNRLIQSLHADGLKPRDIRHHLQHELRETLSLRHIARVIERGEQ